MRTWTRWTARAALFTASFAAVGLTTVGIASAGTHTTSGNGSILGGNQVSVPVSVPIDACGNAAAVLGTSLAGCQGGAFVAGGSGGTWTTSGNHSIGGGNQVNVPVSVPVDVCGNAAAVLGTSLAGCQGGASVTGGAHGSGGTWWTSGNGSIGGGNQASVPVRVPVSVCGNAVGSAAAACKGGAAVHQDAWNGGSTSTTSGNHSILGGNQINVPVSVPVSVCGNAAAVLGGALAGCQGGATVGGGGHSGGGHHHHCGCGHHHGSGMQRMSAAHVVRQSAPLSAGSGSPLSALSGGLPVLGGLPILGGLSGGGTSGSPVSNLPIQTNLTSYTTPAAAPGMGSGSMLAIAVGTVLAGAAALVAAGRRLSLRKTGR